MQRAVTRSAAAAAAALVSVPAIADYDVGFQLSGPGGNAIEQNYELEGALVGGVIDVTFDNQGGWTWAGDLLIGFVDPNGNAAEFGGYDLSFGFPTAGDFPSSWDTSVSGVYSYAFSLEDSGLSGSGNWTIMFADGYSSGEATDQWDGVIRLEGLEAVPAPGALALLGIAGLAGRRPRRS